MIAIGPALLLVGFVHPAELRQGRALVVRIREGRRVAPAGGRGQGVTVRALIVDPSAYSPPYDEALCAALARAGAEVELINSRFAHGERPAPDGYVRRELFYRRVRGASGATGSDRRDRRDRPPGRQARHPRHRHARALRRLPADVVHLQWTPVPWLDFALLPPRPRVLTVHNAAPRSDRLGRARAVGAVIERMDALVVHSEYGRARLLARGIDARRVHVIPHGAFVPGPAGALLARADRRTAARWC